MPFKPRQYKSDKMNFEGMIAKGEMRGPDGFRAENVNGTCYWRGTGWNENYARNGAFPWAGTGGNCDYSGDEYEREPSPTRPLGRNNRTGS